jgi:hypothetical protein
MSPREHATGRGDHTDVVSGDPLAPEPERRRRLLRGRRARLAMVFTPLVVVVGALVLVLGVPWPVVAGAAVVFVVLLALEA